MVWNFVVNRSDPFSLLYLLSSDNSATHLPSVSSWKECLLWLLAFDLKATKLNWILKYFTCSSSTCNSCSSQNNGQVGSLQELIQKSETYRLKIVRVTLNLARELFLFNSCPELFKRCFQSKVLVSDFSWRKVPKWKKKTLHLDIKRQNLVFILPTGRAPKSPFSPEKGVKKDEVKKNCVRNSWKEIF